MTNYKTREDFEAWAKADGYDTAHTYDTDRSRWLFLNPMTADLWRAYQAATQHSAARIAELEAEARALRRDAERLDWLEKNLFSRGPDDWDAKYGICKGGKNWMWAVFAPSGVQGGARRIIDAAIEAERGGA